MPAGPRSTRLGLPSDLVAVKPAGFLWLGLVVALATPLGRVAASLVGYVAGGERRMAFIAAAILAVVSLAVILGLAAPS